MKLSKKSIINASQYITVKISKEKRKKYEDMLYTLKGLDMENELTKELRVYKEALELILTLIK